MIFDVLVVLVYVLIVVVILKVAINGIADFRERLERKRGKK